MHTLACRVECLTPCLCGDRASQWTRRALQPCVPQFIVKAVQPWRDLDT